MFDFTVNLDRDAYAEGDPVVVTVDAGTLAISLDEVKYSLHARITDAGNPLVEQHAGDAIVFTIDGRAATGSAVSGHGMLFVRARDADGRDAATYLRVPLVDHFAGPIRRLLG